ncbi:MAG: hypothetical protein JWN21_461 [Sphingomonas bacterium]|nr:hypothetical protein [Sphingomonas bacterium]
MSTQRATSSTVDLLLACCRWPVNAADVARCAAGVDWQLFAALARRHRVQGLVYRALSQAGLPAAPLAADARRIATDNLRLAAESVRLHRRMAAADVPALLVKGVALGMLAYRDLGVKMGWDIDLLVAPARLETAAAVLGEAGYRCSLPSPGTVSLAEWHAFSKESVWRHEMSGIHVELHSALVDHPLLLPDVGAWSPAQLVELSPGMVLPTLTTDTLFAYLCVHGAASGWRRLKWLADVAALLARGDVLETERLYHRSQALGAGRAAGQALLLSHRHFGTVLTPQLAAALHADRTARLLAWAAARMMLDEEGYDAAAERTWGTLPIHLAQFLLLPGWRYRTVEMRRKLTPDPHVGGSRWAYPVRVLARRWREARAGEGGRSRHAPRAQSDGRFKPDQTAPL